MTVAKKPEIENEMGKISIADDVVATIAGLAASEVDGVAAMSGSWGGEIVEKLGRKNYGKGIKVSVDEEFTAIEVFLSIEYGYAIPTVANLVQNEIKMAVESMTGLKVGSVQVNVVSVVMKKEESKNIVISAGDEAE